MKRFLLILFSIIVLLPVFSISESSIDSLPLVFSNEYADVYFDKISIDGDEMSIYCVCENKTNTDLSFRMSRFLVNGWDIVENPTFDGFFRVSANSKKRDCFEFSKAVPSSGITDPESISSIDFSLELKPWNGGKAIFVQDDYSHYDLVDPENSK